MDNIIIPNPEQLNKTIENMKKDGANKLHILSDFDQTLTKGFYKSQKAASIISHLRNGNYLTSDYAKKSHDLFDKYHPIEIDSKLPIEQRKKEMEEWWKLHFKLLIDSGLDKKTIIQSTKDTIEEDTLDFRENSNEFFNILKDNDIPLIIMSSSVGDLISEFIKQKQLDFNNIHIISNLFEFDKSGKSIKIKKIVHVFNKHELELKSLPIYKELLNRKNVILMGDSLGDLGMVSGFPYDNLIRIGFLNENKENNLEEFKKNYDIIFTDDPDMTYVSELLKKIIG